MSLAPSVRTLLSGETFDRNDDFSVSKNELFVSSDRKYDYSTALLTVRLIRLGWQWNLQTFNIDFLRGSCEVVFLGQGVDYRVDGFLSRRLQAPVVVKYVKSRPNDSGGNAAAVALKQAQKVWKEAQVLCHRPVRECLYIYNVLGYAWHPIAEDTLAVCLVVEYAHYGNFRQYLESKESKPPDHRYDLFMDVLKGLDVLHSCSIIHGDIKMENVLVVYDHSNKQITAKLSDFGSSIVQDTAKPEQAYWGTVLYNAPEVRCQQSSQSAAVIESKYLPACDVFSFGLLAWETFLDGRKFANDNIRELLETDHLADLRPIALEQLRACEKLTLNTSRMMEACLHMALVPDPDKRSSVQQILDRAIEAANADLQSQNKAEQQVDVDIARAKGGEVALTTATSYSFTRKLLEWINPKSWLLYVMTWVGRLPIISWLKSCFKSPQTAVNAAKKNIVTSTRSTDLKLELNENISPRTNEYPILPMNDQWSLFRSVLGTVPDAAMESYPLPWEIQKCLARVCQDLCKSDDRDCASYAAVNTSIHYFVGFGLERDLDRSVEAMKQAAALGNGEALVVGPQLSLAYGKPFLAPERVNLDHLNPRYRKYVAIWLGAQRRSPYTTPCHELIRAGFGGSWTRWKPKQAPLLHNLVMAVNGDGVRQALHYGVIDTPDQHGQTALLLACRVGSAEIVSLLLAAGSDPTYADSYGFTPLHLLVMFQAKDIPVVGSLLIGSSATIDIEARIRFRESFPDFWEDMTGTPLEVAVKAGNVAAVTFLVDNGANVTLPLGWAAGLHRYDLLQIMLESPSSSSHLANWPDANLAEPHYWLSCAHPFRRLLMHGKDHRSALSKTVELLQKYFQFYFTGDAMQRVVYEARMEVFSSGNRLNGWTGPKILDPRHEGNTYKLNPLGKLASQNLSLADIDIAKELLKHTPFDPEFEGTEIIGNAVLGCRFSPFASHGSIVALLLEAGYPADQECGRYWLGYNAFHLAVKTGVFAVADMLLQHDPTLIHSRTNYNNETPLHIAARTSAAMVRFLYDRQADPTLGSGESHAGTLSLGFSMSSITPLGAFINEGLVQTRGEMLSTIMDVSRDSGFVAMKQEGGHHFKGAIHMAAICSSQHPERSHSVHETLRLLLEDDELWIQINQKDSGNRTPLFLACFDGGLAAARILLEAGADPRITYYDRFTEHTFDCLEYTLLQPRIKPSPKAVPVNKTPPRPVEAETWYKLACLLAERLVGSEHDHKYTFMHLAAICGDVAEVERLLISEPESVFQTDYLGRTATVILNDTLMTNLRQRANSEWVCNAERIRGMIENQQEELLQSGLFDMPGIPLYNLLQWKANSS